MSEKGKGVIQIVSEKKKKDGSSAWNIFIDDVEYYDSKGNFKDKKGEEVEFEWAPSQDGNIKFINPVGGGGFKSGGGARGKSPEEIAIMKEEMEIRRKSFALSYSKDLAIAIISGIPVYEGLKPNELITIKKDAVEAIMSKFQPILLKMLS